MPNIKIVAIRRDSNGNMTNRVITTPKSANLIQEGLRASDNMTMTLSAEHDVQVGDEIYYIQDYIDTSSLKAVWNFYGGFRDESGYEHDDVYTAPYTMPACADSLVDGSFTGNPPVSSIDWKHKGYYKFLINSLSDTKNGIEITKRYKNNNTTSSKIPVIDMSGDFDMIFEFKITSNNSSSMYTSQTIFDNYDHATSSGKGLKIQANPSANTITITADNGTTETVMVASSVTTYDVVSFLRIKRQSGVFKLYLDGVEKSLTNSTNSGDFNNDKNIHLFKEYNESTSEYIDDTGFIGIPIQYRFYTGVLDDSEVKKLQISKPVNTTMKFGGKVWKIDNKGSVKKLSCSSHAKEILNTNITSSTFLSQVTATVGDGKRQNNRYYNENPSSTSGRPDMEDILQDILKYVDDGVYVYFADEPSTSFYGDFFAEGTLLDIVKLMMLYDLTAHMFVITARKIMFINDEVQTNHVINQDKYNIVFSGKDDTNTTNSIFTSGRQGKYTRTITVTSDSAQYTWGDPKELLILQNGYYVTPVIQRVRSVMRTDDSGSGSTEIFSQENPLISGVENNSTYSTNLYKINADNTIQFWNETDATATNPTHSYTVVFEYSYTYYKNTNFGTNGSLYWSTTQHYKNTTAIARDGLYHRNLYVPQLVNGLDIYIFNNRYLLDNDTINTRYRVITSSLVNSLTVGQKVRYTDRDGNTSDKVIRSIEYSYPQTVTIIELGEYLFSGFDVEKQTVESLRGLDSVSSGATRY
tara:strand:- start:2322 stop:4577 length:2256 start_codon:yes stop_codon:yes gene_type:complete